MILLYIDKLPYFAVSKHLLKVSIPGQNYGNFGQNYEDFDWN
jgi:hypothetical protein